jgi:hypothetical protein
LALETHENLLHAETQAIAAKQLDTIDTILSQKEESLEIVLLEKSKLETNPRLFGKADELIDRVIELQKRNAELFKKLVDVQSEKNDGNEDGQFKPVDKRLKKAYSTNNFNYNSRINIK